MMNLTDIQSWWIEEHNYVLNIARASKNSIQALFDMYRRYEALNDTEKEQINDLLISWIESSNVANVNNDELYTALALVTEYQIFSAIPAMESLSERLKDCKIPDNPQGYHEREKVLRKLENLKSLQISE